MPHRNGKGCPTKIRQRVRKENKGSEDSKISQIRTAEANVQKGNRPGHAKAAAAVDIGNDGNSSERLMMGLNVPSVQLDGRSREHNALWLQRM
jgi:hypothetical protein